MARHRTIHIQGGKSGEKMDNCHHKMRLLTESGATTQRKPRLYSLRDLQATRTFSEEQSGSDKFQQRFGNAK